MLNGKEILQKHIRTPNKVPKLILYEQVSNEMHSARTQNKTRFSCIPQVSRGY